MSTRDMSDIAYWQKKIEKYRSEEWSKKPSLFANEALEKLPKSGRLLELGCGSGHDGLYFASLGFDVLQTDIADYRNPESKKLAWQSVDMSHPLLLKAESFDVVYAHQAIHYFTTNRTKELIQEIHKILRPNGTLAFIVNSVNDPEYGEGKEIEPGLYKVDGITKRFFSLEYTRQLVDPYFTIVVLDNKGTTYKDRAKDVNNLIRFIGVKK